MPRIILIETSTSLCSTALVEGEAVVEYRQSDEPRSQASLTAPFVKEMLDSRGLKVSDCDAVCVSMGPGSYTGLRVGVSTAKGLSFAGGIPLMAVGTLDILAVQAIEDGLLPEGCLTIVPMIDARRMEVYTAMFDTGGRRLTEIEARVIDAESFRDSLERGPVLFTGDGALKCREVITSPNAAFAGALPRADAMLRPALEAYAQKGFENTAYFEPFYLKQFVATVSRKNLVR